MPGILIRWLVTTLAILMIPHLISGVRVEGIGSALAAAAILGILNALIRPILIVLTLPLTIVTLGLFILVINALLFQFAGWVVSGLHIDSFWSALFGSLIVSVVSWIMNSALPSSDMERTIIIHRSGDPRIIDMRRDKDDRWK
ncbi:MAG: phage holin family protein [Deltaproteobacteria bacterium]|nr:phage holin family protein [Deltaproteobacteria bacterium]